MAAKRGPKRGASERGSAVLVVFILLVMMSVIVVSNSLGLHHLNREIKLIEHKQKLRLESAAPTAQTRLRDSMNSTTNTVQENGPAKR